MPHPARRLAVLTVDNALDPDLMTPAERLAEIGEILAAGLLRLRAREREAGDHGDVSLDFPATPSVHARKHRYRENACKTAC